MDKTYKVVIIEDDVVLTHYLMHQNYSFQFN